MKEEPNNEKGEKKNKSVWFLLLIPISAMALSLSGEGAVDGFIDNVKGVFLQIVGLVLLVVIIAFFSRKK